jgi:hypothetical protein
MTLGQKMLLSVNVPAQAAARAGGDIVKAKIVLANIFTNRPDTRAALSRFGLKTAKLFAEEERVSPRLDILYDVIQESSHDQTEATNTLSSIWDVAMDEAAKSAEPPSPLDFELAIKPEARLKAQLPYNKSLAWALWNSTIRSALLLIMVCCAIILLPHWTAPLVPLGSSGQVLETMLIAIFVCAGLLAIAFLFASIGAIITLGNENRSGTYPIKSTLTCPHCSYRFSARDYPANDATFTCICCERTVTPATTHRRPALLFRMCAAIFKFPVQGS